MKSNPLLRLFIIVLLATTKVSRAVEESNGYVSVEATGSHVDRIVKVGNDFHIVTTNAPLSMKADVTVEGIDPWELDSDDDFQLGIGDSIGWEAHNKDDDEEPGEEGNIILFKVDVEIGNIGELVEESEGAWLEYCTDGSVSLPVSIRCYPANRPDNEMINLSFSAGHLQELDGTTWKPAKTSYKANEIGSVTFRLVGITPSVRERDYSITAVHSANGCGDSAKYTVWKLCDMIVDGFALDGLEIVSHGDSVGYSIRALDQFGNDITALCSFLWRKFNPTADTRNQYGSCTTSDAPIFTCTWKIDDGLTSTTQKIRWLSGYIQVYVSCGPVVLSDQDETIVYKGDRQTNNPAYKLIRRFEDPPATTPLCEQISTSCPADFQGSSTISRTVEWSTTVEGTASVSGEGKAGLSVKVVSVEVALGISGGLSISATVSDSASITVSAKPGYTAYSWLEKICTKIHADWDRESIWTCTTGFVENYGRDGTVHADFDEGRLHQSSSSTPL